MKYGDLKDTSPQKVEMGLQFGLLPQGIFNPYFLDYLADKKVEVPVPGNDLGKSVSVAKTRSNGKHRGS